MTREGEFLLVDEVWQLSNFLVFRLLASLFFLSSFLTFGQEAPSRGEETRAATMKVATVNIQKLFQGYRKTLSAEREIDLARAEIQRKSQLATNAIQAKRSGAEERVFRVRNGNASEEEIADLQRELPLITREIKMSEAEKRRERDLANEKLKPTDGASDERNFEGDRQSDCKEGRSGRL